MGTGRDDHDDVRRFGDTFELLHESIEHGLTRLRSGAVTNCHGDTLTASHRVPEAVAGDRMTEGCAAEHPGDRWEPELVSAIALS